MFEIKEVVTNKFWIVNDKYGKVGTLRACDSTFEFFDNRTMTKTILDDMSTFKQLSDVPTMGGDKVVDGFPTKDVPYPAEHSKLPVYRKTEKGKAVYAAGYYIVKFEGMGWQWAFSPKLDTLNKYQYKGPFRTEWEMNLELKKHKR